MKNALMVATDPGYKAPASDKENRGELACIEIEPAENGWTVECRFEPEDQPGPKVPYPEPECLVFTSAKAALKYVAQMMQEHEAYEADEK